MGASTRSLFTAEKIIYLLLTSNEMSLQTHAHMSFTVLRENVLFPNLKCVGVF